MATNLHSPSQQNYIEQLSIDCVIFGYHEGQLNLLIPKLVFKGDFWALPSGFVFQEEDVDQAAQRILQERTGIERIYLEQFHVFGNANRSSVDFMKKLVELNDLEAEGEIHHHKEYQWITKRFVSIGYYALVDMAKVMPRKSELDESVGWYPLKQLPDMIMDHHEIVGKALETLRDNLSRKLIAFNLLPDTFTMKEVQQLYEAIFDRPFARNNFQKMILDMNVLERLEKKFTGAANKAPFLYRFRQPEEAE